jgi:SpoVK/Ycf46/Vps4 family AAA+-type ATPase
LVLPDDTKDLVLAFAQSQIQRELTFDDVIQGKRRGVIMLLSGPPGVEMTLTAEAVAETMQVPLYVMAAGDLGTHPSEVESSLLEITKMTTRWKAVLLLDEADVYLQARETNDLERNKLVSIFLRVLEYYEGFLFLTSNRIDTIDAAVESRIHLSLQYHALSFESRRSVWMTFLKNQAFTEEQIDVLAQIDLNGRQIKNILKTAQLLVTSKDAALDFGHVQTITKLRAANAIIPLKRKGD